MVPASRPEPTSRASRVPVDAHAPMLPRTTLSLVTVIAGLYIALAEIDRLIGRVSSSGYAASLGAANMPRLPVPWPGAQSHPWLTLHNLDARADGFVVTYTVIDCALALTYGWLLWAMLGRLSTSRAIRPGAPLRLLTRPRPWLAAVAAGADVLENVALAGLTLGGHPGVAMSPGLAGLTGTLTAAKWIALALAVAPLLYALAGTARGRTWVMRWGRALLMQRFSLMAVIPVAALALVPGPGIFDQLPDVQRAWFELGRGHGVPGPVHAASAIVFLGLISFGLFVLGRLFTDHAMRRTGPAEPRPRAPLWQWLYAPVVLGVTVVALLATGSGHLLRTVPLLILCAVPIGIHLASWALRRWHPDQQQPPALAYDQATARQIWRAGDLLALAGVVVASLALVRSHTVLLALAEGNVVQWLMPVLGLGTAVVVWWVGIPALTWIGNQLPLVRHLIQPAHEATLVVSTTESADARPPTPRGSRRLWRLAWVFILVSTLVLGTLALNPVLAAHWLGVLGAVMLALGAIMLLVGSSAVVHAFYAPPEIFWTRWFRLREAPVASLVTLTALVAMLSGSTAAVHGVRQDAPPVGQPASYRTTVQQWQERTAGAECLVELEDGTTARPLLLVAAEGGGIRAAYWTTAVLQLLEDRTGCGVDSVAVASGVSGGAVGLAVARATPASDLTEAVWRMGEAGALGQASLGLLTRDPLYTVAGVPSPMQGLWLDRAALMEMSWERSWRESAGGQQVGGDGLGGDFYAPAADKALAAALVLNSTDGTTGCRVLITHLDLAEAVTLQPGSPAPGPGSAARCTDSQAPLAYSRDIRAYLGTGGEDDHCLDGLRLSTAAMLAARFPYVTPSGVVGPCGSTPRAQLIDGGYAEGSGLGSLVDLAPGLLAALAQETETEVVPVLPVVVFLDNGRGGDLLPVPPRARSELLVPPLGALTAGSTQRSAAAWLHRAQSLSTAAPSVLTPRVYVVAQGSEPTVEAPLGWVLSQASRADMDRSLAEAAADACGDPTGAQDGAQPEAETALNQGYPNVAELLALLGACE